MKTIVLVLTSVILISASQLPGQNQTCLSGYVLCDNQPVTVNYMQPGKIESVTEMPCFPNKLYFNEITFYWKMKDPYLLELDLIPLDAKDDIDFILYKLEESNLDCSNWESKRCMAEGPNLVNESEWYPCAGITGLSTHGKSSQTLFGCQLPSTNYLSSISSEEGDLYALRVMNFTSYNGFILNFNKELNFQSAEIFPLETTGLQAVDLDMIQSTSCIQKIGTKITQNVDVPISSSISLFPNPSSTTLSVASKEIVIKSYRLVDHSGKVINFSNVEDPKKINIPVHYLQSGIYLLELKNTDGQSYFRQFVKI
ncbi:MAG TPA: T9SS type A sorting domain-containing protein [Saprospiraceae bacterium]|nr:T9SS type A sorting domain-containing protein [Saprospiraceae bacterium]